VRPRSTDLLVASPASDQPVPQPMSSAWSACANGSAPASAAYGSRLRAQGGGDSSHRAAVALWTTPPTIVIVATRRTHLDPPVCRHTPAGRITASADKMVRSRRRQWYSPKLYIGSPCRATDHETSSIRRSSLGRIFHLAAGHSSVSGDKVKIREMLAIGSVRCWLLLTWKNSHPF